MESVEVLHNLFAVVLDVGVVLINVAVVVGDVHVGVGDAVLEGSDGLTESLSADEHLTSHLNLELVSMFAEKGSLSVESIDSGSEFWGDRVRGRGGLRATVVHMHVVGVVVGGVGTPAGLGFEGSCCADEECSGKDFH